MLMFVLLRNLRSEILPCLKAETPLLRVTLPIGASSTHQTSYSYTQQNPFLFVIKYQPPVEEPGIIHSPTGDDELQYYFLTDDNQLYNYSSFVNSSIGINSNGLKRYGIRNFWLQNQEYYLLSPNLNVFKLSPNFVVDKVLLSLSLPKGLFQYDAVPLGNNLVFISLFSRENSTTYHFRMYIIELHSNQVSIKFLAEELDVFKNITSFLELRYSLSTMYNIQQINTSNHGHAIFFYYSSFDAPDFPSFILHLDMTTTLPSYNLTILPYSTAFNLGYDCPHLIDRLFFSQPEILFDITFSFVPTYAIEIKKGILSNIFSRLGFCLDDGNLLMVTSDFYSFLSHYILTKPNISLAWSWKSDPQNSVIYLEGQVWKNTLRHASYLTWMLDKRNPGCVSYLFEGGQCVLSGASSLVPAIFLLVVLLQ